MTTQRKGLSLAKGPVAILGAAMVALGILALVLGSNSFEAVDVPDGPITSGETFLGMESNGWTALLWIAAGGLLLFGSPLHWAAKSMALIVGLVLGAASLISLVTQWADGTWGVFGIFAADNWTTLAWGAVATALLVSALLPRVGGRRDEETERTDPAVVTTPPARPRPAAPTPPRDAVIPDADRRDRVVRERAREPVAGGRRVVAPADGDGPSDHGRHDPR